jgi:DnaJ-domain-containing protein 1
MQDALTGHRPTWKISDIEAFSSVKLEDALHHFRSGGEAPRREAPHPTIPPEQHKALAILQLEGTETWEEIHQHYRTLVKKYHPDLHQGSKKSEERFKLINGAYHYLRQQHKPLA